MLLIISGCEENQTSENNNSLIEKSAIEIVNNNGTLNLSAHRVMCSGQVPDASIKMKEHCQFTQIRENLNIYDKKEKLIKVQTKIKGHVSVNLPEGEYLIKNTPTPLIPLQEVRVVLVSGTEQEIEVNLLVSLPKARPLID
jgi:hypothetical protein